MSPSTEAGLRATIRNLRDELKQVYTELEKARRQIAAAGRPAHAPPSPNGKGTLTDRQQQILNFILLYQEKYGMAPTRQEIALAFEFASVNAVEQHILAIRAKGWIAPPSKARTMRSLQVLP